MGRADGPQTLPAPPLPPSHSHEDGPSLSSAPPPAAGYEMRTYWFEVFECLRKLALVGLPIFFEPGSSGQIILGLLVCFLAFGMYAHFAPYITPDDDTVAAASQTSIFFALLASLITSAYPDDVIMSALLPLVAAAPALLTVLFETPFLSEVAESCGCAASASGERTGRCDRLLVCLRDAITVKLDRLLGAADAQATQAAYRESMRTLQGQHTRRTLLQALAREDAPDRSEGEGETLSEPAPLPPPALDTSFALPQPAPLPSPASDKLTATSQRLPPSGASTTEVQETGGEGAAESEVSSNGVLAWLGSLVFSEGPATVDDRGVRRTSKRHVKLTRSLSRSLSTMRFRATNRSHKLSVDTPRANKDAPPSARSSFGSTDGRPSCASSTEANGDGESVTHQKV